MTLMITKKKINILSIIICFFLASCSTPGMHMNQGSKESIYIESLGKEIDITKLSQNASLALNKFYRIGNGDQISVTVWGLPQVFPITNINTDQNLRRVDSKGNIFFPYVGTVKASGKTQDELRDLLTDDLGKYFNSPQLDLSIAKFNSQQVYILGEVTKPIKINITDIPLTLSTALGEAYGLSTTTASGSEVFIIRQSDESNVSRIFRADLSSPSGFLSAGSFRLMNNDIIYVNANNTTRWNRIISQFFPFSSFLNSIDSLTTSN